MKFFKTILVSVIIALFIGTLSSCDKGYLEVNKNPNTVNDVGESLLLPAILGDFSWDLMSHGNTRTVNFWMQQIASNNSTSNSDNYSIAFGTFGSAYTDILINAKILIKSAEKDKYYDYSAIAKAITAWTIVYVSNGLGPIPWSQALQPEKYPNPKFDSQKSIYKAAQNLLDEAIKDLAKNSIKKPSDDDLLYHGDMEKWKRFIYTVKAKLYLNLTNAPGHNAVQQYKKVLAALKNGFKSNADDADFAYYDSHNRRNPYWQWAISDKWHDFYPVSKHYIKLLKSLNDPRLHVQARENVNGKYRGHQNGNLNRENEALMSEIGKYYSSPDSPVTWLSYAQVEFMKAEATLGVSGAVAAQSIFENAIMASMDKLGISKSKASAYIASLPTLQNSPNPLKELMTQKYIASFLNISVYNDWRRTGYPTLKPVPNHIFSMPQIPVRFAWPTDILNNNESSLKATGIPTGVDGMKVHVWWDQ